MDIRTPMAAILAAKNKRAQYEAQAYKDFAAMQADEAQARKYNAEATGIEGVNKWRASTNPRAVVAQAFGDPSKLTGAQATAARLYEALMPGVIALAKDATDLTQAPINLNRGAGGQLQMQAFDSGNPVDMFNAGQIAEGKPSERFKANEAGVTDVASGNFNLHELGRAKVATEGAQQGAYGASAAASRASAGASNAARALNEQKLRMQEGGFSPQQISAMTGLPIEQATAGLNVATTGEVPVSSTARVRSPDGKVRSMTPEQEKTVGAVNAARQALMAAAGGNAEVMKLTGLVPTPPSKDSEPNFTENLTRVTSDRIAGYDPAAAQDFLRWAAQNGFNPEASDAEFNRAYAAYVRQTGGMKGGGGKLSADELQQILNEAEN